MAVANLFKHKIRFELSGHDSNWYEPTIPNKGYHYSSNWIENGESVGIRSACDLFIDKLKPLFLHIISTMYHEAEMEISSIDITVGVFELGDYYDIVGYKFTSAPNDAITNYSRSWVHTFPEGLLNNKFCIHIESYVYMVDDNVREENAYYEEQERRLPNQEMEEDELYISPTETYREDRCVICLEKEPNILYLNCDHIVVCDSCDRLKKTGRKNCDVCREKIFQRLKI